MPYIDPVTTSTGQIMGASDWNTYIRDNMRSMNRFTSYTPVWTADTTNPVLNNGVLVGSYVKLEQLCYVDIHLTMGSTTTYGSGNYHLSLPFASVTSGTANYRQIILGVVLNDGVGWGNMAYVVDSGASIGTMLLGGTYPVGFATPTNPFTFGTNDLVHIQGWYRTS